MFVWLFAIIVGIFMISFWVNNEFVYRYYLYELKQTVTKVANEVRDLDAIESVESADETLFNFEKKYNVTMVYTPMIDDNSAINNNIINKLEHRQIPLNKFFVTDDILKSVKEGNISRAIFNQGKMKSSILCSFVEKDGFLVVTCVAVTHDSDVIGIINSYYAVMIAISLIIILGLVWLLSRKITEPLHDLIGIAEDISNLHFRDFEIKTGDEIEALGNAIKTMSIKLEKSQKDLQIQNENLKRMIANISHELNTPTALIKAYIIGIQDGLDDGTYSDIILKQADRTSELLEYLLSFSRLDKEVYNFKRISIAEIIKACIYHHQLIIEKNNIEMTVNIDDCLDAFLLVDAEKMALVFNNLLMNAIKYTSDKKINIELVCNQQYTIFSISNGVCADLGDITDDIWEPFYVMEVSRDKRLSGYGLGLSIVKNILEKHNCQFSHNVSEGMITFTIIFPNKIDGEIY